jgi:hypothetical protein
LLFGEGGFYTEDDLNTRGELLEQLRSAISSLKLQMQHFIFSLNNIE